MCLYFVFFFTAHMSYYCNTVGWTWWDWSLILRTLSFFSALTLLVGSFDRTNPSPIWAILCLAGRWHHRVTTLPCTPSGYTWLCGHLRN